MFTSSCKKMCKYYTTCPNRRRRGFIKPRECNMFKDGRFFHKNGSVTFDSKIWASPHRLRKVM